jgi:hypothetical protein
MTTKQIEFAVWEDDPCVIVSRDTGAIDCYVKRGKDWKFDRDVYIKAKLTDEETFKRMFPDAGMPASASA